MNKGTYDGVSGFSRDFGKIVTGLEYANTDYAPLAGDMSRTFPAPEEYCKTWPAVTVNNVDMPIIASSMAWDPTRKRFIAIGCKVDTPGSFFTSSPNGFTWEPATLVSTPSGGANTIWVQVGVNTSTGRYVLLSEDMQETVGTLNLYYAYSDDGGSSWTSGTGVSNYIGSGSQWWYGTGPITWDGTAFISAPIFEAFTNGSVTPKPVRSTDGISWSVGTTSLGSTEEAKFYPVGASSSKAVLKHMTKPYLLTSADHGSNWTTTASGLNNISYDPLSSLFYAQTLRGFAYSTDAVTWSAFQSTDVDAESIGPVTYYGYGGSTAFTDEYVLFLDIALHVSHKKYPLRKTYISLYALADHSHAYLCSNGSTAIAYPGPGPVRAYYTLSTDYFFRSAASCSIINIDSSAMMLPHYFAYTNHYIKVR